MEFFMPQHNCKVRITCGGVPFEQIKDTYRPPEELLMALGSHLARKYGAKDAWWPGEVPPWEKEEGEAEA